MRRFTVIQGSREWLALRLGIPTASRFSEIITPTGKPSASADGYMHELLAERLIGQPMDSAESGFMQRGSQMEAEAVAWYELQRDVDVERVGFCLHEHGAFGCSPDALVADDGGLEIKCPSAPNHIGYMLEGFPKKYMPQVQGCMWITGRAWWDCLSYNPELPTALVRIHRDEEYIDRLSEAVTAFSERLDAAHAKLEAMMPQPERKEA